MTKAKARSLATFLDVRCDDAFLFVVKVGKSGYIIDIDDKGSFFNLLSLLLNTIDNILLHMNLPHQADSRKLLIASLLEHLDYKPAPKPEENFSNKQLRKRDKHNQFILDAVEAVL